MINVEAILNGEDDFPVIGATGDECLEMFRQYALLCGRAREIIALNNDAEDYEEICACHDAVSELLPAMRAMTEMMLTQDKQKMLQLFADEFMTDQDCLYFLEIMRANTGIDAFINRMNFA